jgi:hypothetical protein
VRGRHAAALLVTAVTVGCGSGPPVPTWEEPPDYRFAVESTCGERAFVGDYRVTVRDGSVAGADWFRSDDERWVPVEAEDLDGIPTLGDLLDEARAARERDADVLEVRTDPGDGHPTEVRIDPDRRAIDEESCYLVTDYAIGG